MKLDYAPEAIADIQQVRQYIAVVLKNRTAAARIVKMLTDHCKQLKVHPQLGMSLAAKLGEASELRFLVCENWLVFYRLREDSVQIVRVLDGRTDYLRILFQN